ncbi:rudimentary enhancer [Fimicolochytrium jonesii]|uniref:rudimentary enhancer n=1 Tax=Fimicolochytrium jonesii TaxID=1396493 RepID=UPI0022FDE036|nr:rudimentary enhancer [Fimicolochytrium jonesii]KAI8823721.1 rudimentary enhancer [Fimicolochytrium jonesii]
MTQHTILLLQTHANRKDTRQWEDHDTVSLAVESVISKFEQRLKQSNPTVRNIQYDINDLQKYIDSLGDVACLVLDPTARAYIPHDRDWFKARVFNHLKRQASAAR